MSGANHANEGVICPPATLAVIGGGQLGRMFIQAAQRMGYRTGVLTNDVNAPAAQIAHWSIVGEPNDLEALRSLTDRAEAVTVEFENIQAGALRLIARQVPTRPGGHSLWVCQNRIREKNFLDRHAIPIAPWRPVRNEHELSSVISALGLPIVLKTAASGYDGKGQVRVERAGDLGSAWESLGRVACVAEAWVEFTAEASVVAVRGRDGKAATYPLAWNQHTRHILDSTLMPAACGPVLAREASATALAAAEALGHVGILTVEYFLKSDGRLLVNEMAPRPHNSGHLTIEAGVASQFDQQVRALCGLPLAPCRLIRPAAMVNLLGDLWRNGEPRWEAALAADPAVSIHLYGKDAAVAGRKMGHLTVLDSTPEEALARAHAARRRLVE